MIFQTDFGQFISEQRKRHSMQSQELAKMLGITIAYLSQLEHGVRTNPDRELLKKLIDIFHLNQEESETMYDLYAVASGTISPDIEAYVASHPIAVKALRIARNANINDADWLKLIEWLKMNSNFAE